MSFRLEIHYSDSDVTIIPKFKCMALNKFNPELNFKTKRMEYQIADLEKICKTLKDSGLFRR